MMIYLSLYLLATLLTIKLRLRRAAMALLLPWLALDCVGCLLAGGNLRTTLSAEAWRHRTDEDYWWCHGFIDWIFGKNHCRQQDEVETLHGGVWRAWAAEWKGR